MAIGADRGFLRTGGDCVSVHTLLVGSHHLRALAAIFHHKFLAVAGAAGRGNVGVMHARLGIAGGEQFVRAAVAIYAGGGFAVASLHSFAVEAPIVRCLLVGMARRARNLLRSCFVSGAGYVRMAVHAGEHAAVNGVFKGLRIDMQAGGLAVDVVRERGVAMAGQAFVGRRFRGLFGSAVERSNRQKKQGEGNSRRKNIPYCSRGHALTRQFFKVEFCCGRAQAAFRCPDYLARLRMYATRPLMSSAFSLPS